MKTYEERREEEREERADVDYEVWRSGGNPDNVDYDRVSDGIYDGLSSEQIASREIRIQREQRERKRELENEE